MSVALRAGIIPRCSSSSNSRRPSQPRAVRHIRSMAAAVPEGHPCRASDWLELNGKVALITGGASGLGSACATELARHGVKVAIADVRSKLDGRQQAHKIAKEAAEKVEAEDASDVGLTCEPIYVECDVASRASVDAAVAAVVEQLGDIDVLINNAGINVPRLLVDPAGKEELDEATWDRVLAINTKGVFLCTQAVVRRMLRDKKAGVVINVASEAGMQGSSGQSAYAASKGGVYALTRSWAKELGGAGVRVVGISPGVLEKTGLRTPEYERALAYTRGQSVEELRKTYSKGIPLGREGRLREVADVVAFLASPRSSYLTGTIVNVSGGKSFV